MYNIYVCICVWQLFPLKLEVYDMSFKVNKISRNLCENWRKKNLTGISIQNSLLTQLLETLSFRTNNLLFR